MPSLLWAWVYFHLKTCPGFGQDCYQTINMYSNIRVDLTLAVPAGSQREEGGALSTKVSQRQQPGLSLAVILRNITNYMLGNHIKRNSLEMFESKPLWQFTRWLVLNVCMNVSPQITWCPLFCRLTVQLLYAMLVYNGTGCHTFKCLERMFLPFPSQYTFLNFMKTSVKKRRYLVCAWNTFCVTQL